MLGAGLARRAGVAEGGRVRVQTPDGPARWYAVAGTVTPEPDGQEAVYFDAAFGGPGADAVGVLKGPGIQRLRDALKGTGLRVLPPRDAARAEAPGVAAEYSTAGFVLPAGLAGLVAALGVAGTFNLALAQRRREFGLLRAVGATPRQVRRTVAKEALAVSLAGGVPGALAGTALAAVIGRALVRAGVYEDGFHVRPDPAAFAGTVAFLVVLTQAAVWATASRAARVHPAEAMREATLEGRGLTRRRLAAGLVALAGAAALLVASLVTGGDRGAEQGFLLTLALMLACALLAPLAARPVTAPLQVRSAEGMLAVAAIRTAPRRLASAVTPIVMVAAVSGALMGAGAAGARADRRDAADRVTSDVVVRAEGGLPPDAAARAAATPGVRAAFALKRSTVLAGQGTSLQSASAVGVDPEAFGTVLRLRPADGSAERLRGDWIIAPAAQASLFGWRVGRPATLWLADGTTYTAPLVAVTPRNGGWAGAIVPRTVLARVSPMDAEIHVRTSGDGARARAGLAALAEDYPGLRTSDRAAYLRGLGRGDPAAAAFGYLVLGLIVLFAAVSAINTLAMAAARRTGEFALLRLCGATPRQVSRAVRAESLIVTALALVLGGAITWLSIGAASFALGGPFLPVLPVGQAAALVAGCVAIGVLSAVVPARLALRADPLAASQRT
ncbi:ABC transporter permease [Actinomadura yumaensis]|uniref:ABC transporter permease n=1 Tax=Actinomadura yumaensis TaxID=111807 RepID=UPI00361A3150